MEAANEEGVKEEYFMLAHELPEDQNLREKLQRERLVGGSAFSSVISQSLCICFSDRIWF